MLLSYNFRRPKPSGPEFNDQEQNCVMFVHLKPRLIILFTLAGFMTLDVPQVDAQGIFQRLGSRIRSRIPVPPPPPILPPGRTVPPQGTRVPSYQANRPPESGNPNQTDNRSFGNRLSPISPDDPGRNENDRAADADSGPSVLRPMENDESRQVDARQRDRAATMGIRVVDPRPGFPAVQVVSFDEGSLAAKAGIQVGDSILAVEGVPTPNIASIAAQLSDRKPGESVEVYLDRRGRLMRANVELIATRRGFDDQSIDSPVDGNDRENMRGREAATAFNRQTSSNLQTEPDRETETASSRPRLGIDVESQPGQRGALVVAVAPDSPAALSGVRVGDRIVAIDNRFVASPDRLAEVLAFRDSPLAPMEVKLVRDDQLMDLTLSIDTAASPKEGGSSATASSGSERGGSSGSSGSMLEGLGSRLGGWLAGGSPGSANRPGGSATEKTAERPESPQQPAGSETLPAPAPQPSNDQPSNDQPANDQPSTNRPPRTETVDDPLEFGDQEPLERVLIEDSRRKLPE